MKSKSISTAREVSSLLKNVILLLLTFVAIQAQAAPIAAGSYTYGTGGTYASLSAALTALNTNGIAGVVVLNPQAGYTAETAPAGGLRLGSAVLNPTLSAANTLTINGAATFTITAPTGTSTTSDAVLFCSGVDYVTLNALRIQESATNTTAAAAMEFGIAFVKLNAAAPFDGCNNNLIQNCTITLNRSVSTPSIAIYFGHNIPAAMATALGAITNVNDLSSNNRIYGNTISNVMNGIEIVGYAAATPFTYYDQNNDIGGSAAGTGNSITNFGSTVYALQLGIEAAYQNNCNISYNTINNLTGGGVNPVATEAGIYMYGSQTFFCNNNNISVTCASVNTIYYPAGIYGNSALSNITANNNTISSKLVAGSLASPAYGIFTPNGTTLSANSNSITVTQAVNGTIFGINSSSTTGTITASGNTIDISTSSTTALSAWIYSSLAGTTLNVQNNIFQSTGGLTTTTGLDAFIYVNSSPSTINITGNRTSGTITKTGSGGNFMGFVDLGLEIGTLTVSNNNFSNISVAGTTLFYGIDAAGGNTATSQNKIITYDTISNITVGTSDAAMIVLDYQPNTSQVNNNYINNITSGANLYGIAFTSYNVVSTASANVNGGTISDNRISNLSSTAASAQVKGIFCNASLGTFTATIHKDTVTNLSVSGNTAPSLCGIQTGTGSSYTIDQAYINTFSASTTTGNATVNGITVPAGTTVSIFKNDIYGLSTGTSAGATTRINGLNLTSAASTYNVYNNFISGLTAPSATNINSIVGINAGATGSIWNVYYNTVYIGSGGTVTSSGATFGAQGVLYPNGASLLTLKNNIINVNATPNGTGFVAAVCRNAAGTACTAPTITNFNANNNIYYTNAGANNYLYVDGTSTANLRNGYAMSGLTASVANNIVNDIAFNISCGIYKQFMATGGRETLSASENNLVAGTISGTYAPSGASYAESNGVSIATPSITDDYSGTTRGATPDIGALMFSGTAIAKAPSISPATPAAVCAPATVLLTASPVGTGITYQWLNSSGAIAGQTNSTYSAATTGTYSVQVTVTNPCGGNCSVTTPVGVTVTITTGQPITGTTTVCQAATTTLSNTVAGGTWASSNGNATVGVSDGVVTGVTAGTSIITYTTSGGCTTTTIVTVYAPPSAISGPTQVCQTQTITETNLVGGGTWSSTANATVGATSGIVTGVTAGTATISYATTSCTAATKVITINPQAPITGAAGLCLGYTSTLFNTTAGGAWSSSNTSVASIASNGVVTPISTGTATISYLLSTGCLSTIIVTVNAIGPVTGALTVCVNSTTALANIITGGTWSINPTSVATINPTIGVVTGVSAGVATATYTLSSGCTATGTILVNAVPVAIAGPSVVCRNSTITLTDASPGGTWSSSANASVISAAGSGYVTGVTAGTAVVTYTLPTTCAATKTITINDLPANITPNPANVCIGLTTVLSTTSTGGTWISSNTAVGTIGSTTGIAGGIAAGFTTITYRYTLTGCQTTSALFVNAPPSPTTTNAAVCEASSIVLTNSVPGGIWTSSAPANASVGSSSGIVTGITTGIVIISYSTTSCVPVTYQVTVNPRPAPIMGFGSVCVGYTTTLSDATPGGTWSASDTFATVTSTGVVTGHAYGNSTVISYTLPTGCYRAVPIVVDSLPADITGTDSVCKGSSVTLSNLSPGGIWSSSNGTIATAIAVTGEVIGVNAGNAFITYTLISGCHKQIPFKVIQPLAADVSITTSAGAMLCEGTPVTFTAHPVNGGTPTYEWRKFGSFLDTGASIIYTPAHGDYIMCIMYAHNICSAPNPAKDSVTMTVYPDASPTVRISTNYVPFPGSGSSACNPVNGINMSYSITKDSATLSWGAASGSTGYEWAVTTSPMSPASGTFTNSTSVLLTGLNSYTHDYYTTVRSRCATGYSDWLSNPLVINYFGQPVTFITDVTYGGTAVTYQWYKNNVAIPGANGHTYSEHIYHNDTFSCSVTSNAPCQMFSTAGSNRIIVLASPLDVPAVSAGDNSLTMFPNPNTGTFMLTGDLKDNAGEAVTMEVSNMVGQIVYTGTLSPNNGKVNEQVILGNDLTPGNYILKVKSTSGNQTFHFVLQN